MLGLWGFTEHQSAWHNENLLVFSPLCLLLLPTWWRSARARLGSHRTSSRGLPQLIALLAAFALFSKILSTFPQANLPWILLLLPAHLVLARNLWVNGAAARVTTASLGTTADRHSHWPMSAPPNTTRSISFRVACDERPVSTRIR